MNATVRAAAPRRLLGRIESAKYCGVSLTVFDTDWRPFLPTVPKSLRSSHHEVTFDMHDLDELIEQRKRPARVSP
jgi:predicted DNA-binding transcriptional regulator AlpA